MALVAAAVGFHRREDKPYWWGHFDRLSADLEDLDSDRETMVVREARVIEDWHKPPRKQNLRRTLELAGDMPAGSELEREKNAQPAVRRTVTRWDCRPAASPGPGDGERRRSTATRRPRTTPGRTVLRVTEVLATRR